MNFTDFNAEMNKHLNKLNMTLNQEQLNMFYCYMNMLIEKNKVMNLTSITDPKEIILKHFIDSLTSIKYIQNNESVIDIGTGAGFPGIPIKIYNKTLKICLLDSLNKRINFLNEVITQNNLKNITCVHGRAEEFGQNKDYRESFDIAISRAVAPLNILLEYMLPFVKVGGQCICMKGNVLEEEINNSKYALKILGGEIVKIDKFKLTETENSRALILVKKTKNTNSKYPRTPGMPAKKPLQ